LRFARLAKIRFMTESGPVPRNVGWRYDTAFGSSVLRVKLLSGDLVEGGWLRDGAASGAISLTERGSRSGFLRFYDYVVLGFTHILPKGLDHILFVVGLYLLSAGWRPLLAQVTAFTVAHSITLALGLYGVIDIPASIVEPLIALSIVYVAIENMLRSTLSAWRPFVVFAFGLLHGLGFANVLLELGLERSDTFIGLIGFNVGVELGQLAVIALAWGLSGYWFGDRPWYRRRIVWPASAIIAVIGLLWTVERLTAA
jgi:hydrogenase/urease accessory protein HupE